MDATLSEKKQTTAIYPNRQRDKARVETVTGLKEFGNDSFVFRSKYGNVLFIGYRRVVYGDHGPYIEFEPSHAVDEFQRKFNTLPPKNAFYEWLIPSDGSGTKIYLQLRDVKNLKNPPKGGFVGNRQEGYADYIPGMYYVSPFDIVVESFSS